MLRTLAERKDTRPCILFYGSKSREEILFREEIADFESALNLRVIHVLSDPEDDWEGDTGFLTPDLLDRELPETPGDYDYYICGPEPMMNLVERELGNRPIPLRQILSERFQIV